MTTPSKWAKINGRAKGNELMVEKITVFSICYINEIEHNEIGQRSSNEPNESSEHLHRNVAGFLDANRYTDTQCMQNIGHEMNYEFSIGLQLKSVIKLR